MKFSLTAVTLAFAATVAATPTPGKKMVPDDMTVEQGVNKCGNEAKLKCCNEANYNSGDVKNAQSGLLGLGSLLGSNGPNSPGLGLFDQCSDLGVGVGVLGAGASQLLNSKCEQNIACCQDSGTEQVSPHVFDLEGNMDSNVNSPASSTLAFPALLSAPLSKGVACWISPFMGSEGFHWWMDFGCFVLVYGRVAKSQIV